MNLHTKKSIAEARRVTQRTVDNWVKRSLLPAPMKLGDSLQSRVRWTDDHIAQLDRNLATLGAKAGA